MLCCASPSVSQAIQAASPAIRPTLPTPCVNLDSTHAQLYDQPVKCCVAVLEDMLWGFMGFEGKYIKADRARSSKGGVSFVLRGKLDAAVHELVARMLPIWYACQY